MRPVYLLMLLFSLALAHGQTPRLSPPSEAPPVVTISPSNQTQMASGTIWLTAEVFSATAVSYQWNWNGQPILGATNAVLQLSHIAPGRAGNYTVTASNAFGTVESEAATVVVTPFVEALPGGVDPVFAPVVNGTLNLTVEQADGKILLGGDFLEVNGRTAIDVARLDQEGNLDPTFILGSGASSTIGEPSYVRTIVPQRDGKILIGGRFDQFDGMSRHSLARLNADGSVDASFDPGAGAVSTNALRTYESEDVMQIIPQADGKIIVTGQFDLFGGLPAKKVESWDSYPVTRLNADGSVDPSFDPSTDPNLPPNPFQPRQSSGKRIVLRTNPAQTLYSLIQRLNSDGTIDPTFQNSSNFFYGSAIAVLPDDKIIAQPLGPNGLGPIVRFLPDGDLDRSFSPVFLADGSASFYGTQIDGKILISGSFTEVDGISRFGFARLYGDTQGGMPFVAVPPAEQTTYVGQTVRFVVEVSSASPAHFQWQFQGQDLPGATNRIFEIQRVQLGQAGDYTVKVQNAIGTTISSAAHLTVFGSAAGTLDTWFPGGKTLDGAVNTLLMQPDGKWLVGGGFTHVNGRPQRGIARLLSDGSNDLSFNPGTGIAGHTNVLVDAIALQPDGRVLIGGQFDTVDGQPRLSIARLNTDGSLDADFHPDSGPDRFVKSIAVQINGQILAGGTFHYKDEPFNFYHLVRLNTNGTLDTAYHPDPRGDGCHYIYCWDYSAVNALIVRPDGKTLVAGGISRFNYVNQGGKGIGRLNADGTTDTNFNANMTLGSPDALDLGVPVLTAVARQPDGKLVVAGNFSYYYYAADSIPGVIQKLDRLNPDGGRDTNFVANFTTTDTDGDILALALQPDGKILVGGNFTKLKGTLRNRMARVNADGTLDMLFDAGLGPDGPINAILVLKDGSILIGGGFTHVNGTEQRGLARLYPNLDAVPYLSTAMLSAGGLGVSWRSENGKSYVLETATSLSASSWNQVTNVVGDGTIKTFNGQARDVQRYYRLRVQ